MSKFIKIKNGTGKGDLVLRAKFVLKATDADDGAATITYGDNFPDAWQIKTTSTAAEVLAAIEGAHQSSALSYLDRYAERLRRHTTVAYRETDGGPKQYAVSVGEGLCICKELPGDNPECPMCHLSPHAMGAVPAVPRVHPHHHLALFAQDLACELENKTGVRWRVQPWEVTESHTRFRCQENTMEVTYVTREQSIVGIAELTDAERAQSLVYLSARAIDWWLREGRPT